MAGESNEERLLATDTEYRELPFVALDRLKTPFDRDWPWRGSKAVTCERDRLQASAKICKNNGNVVRIACLRVCTSWDSGRGFIAKELAKMAAKTATRRGLQVYSREECELHGVRWMAVSVGCRGKLVPEAVLLLRASAWKTTRSDCYHGREPAKNEYRSDVEGTESTPLQSRRLCTLECRVEFPLPSIYMALSLYQQPPVAEPIHLSYFCDFGISFAIPARSRATRYPSHCSPMSVEFHEENPPDAKRYLPWPVMDLLGWTLCLRLHTCIFWREVVALWKYALLCRVDVFFIELGVYWERGTCQAYGRTLINWFNVIDDFYSWELLSFGVLTGRMQNLERRT